LIYKVAVYCDVESECKELIKWNEFERTQVIGGVKNTTAHTVAECQNACKLNSSCTGLDWDSSSADRCWLHGPWSGKRYDGNVPGITHYDISRICSGMFLF